jgi:hypothetical protein
MPTEPEAGTTSTNDKLAVAARGSVAGAGCLSVRPAGVAVVYLVRHGRTALNAGGLLRGRSDPALDEVGCGEAAALGGLLRDVELAGVVTSPLLRARQTAEAIAVASGCTVALR